MFFLEGIAWDLTDPDLSQAWLSADTEIIDENPELVKAHLIEHVNQPSPLVPDEEGNITLEFMDYAFTYPQSDLSTIRDVLGALATIFQMELDEDNLRAALEIPPNVEISYEDMANSGNWILPRPPNTPVKIMHFLGESLYFVGLNEKFPGHYSVNNE